MISLSNEILLSLEKKILLVAAMQTNLEDSAQSEISQVQKENIFHLHVKFKTKWQTRRDREWSLSQGGEEEKKWREYKVAEYKVAGIWNYKTNK